MIKKLLIALSLVLSLCKTEIASAQIAVSDTADAWALIRTLVGEGVTVTGPTLVCPNQSKGTFSGSTTLGINNGIILTTGVVESFTDAFGIYVPGIDSVAGAFAHVDNTGLGDPSLDSIIDPFITLNSCALTFNFVPIDSYFTFRYVFASEEYPEYACTPFNDVFAFLISGPGYSANTNLALVPGTSIPVAINSINPNDPMVDTFGTGGDTSICSSMGPGAPFPLYYRDNSSGLEIIYDGMTTVLSVSGKVAPCANYRMKIAIGDAGDEGYDSGVFLEENSFSSGAQISASTIIDSTSNMLIEGCVNGRIRLRVPVARSSAQTLSLSYGGDAISGVDYIALPTSISIPGGRDTASIFVNVINDALIENDDTIIIYINNPCTLLPYDSTYLIIHNNIPDTLTYNLCLGDSILVNGIQRGSVGFYRDTFTNALNCDSIVVFHVASVAAFLSSNITSNLCAGDSTFFNGVWLRVPATYSDTFLSVGGCDSFVNMQLLVFPRHTTLISNSICAGETILFNGVLRSTAGIYYDTLRSIHNCDSTIELTLSVRPISSSIQSFTICPSDSIFIGGIWRDAAGIYYDTLVSSNGCDSIIQTTVNIYPVINDTISISICAGDSVMINGTYRSVAGYYPTFFADVHGCDSALYSQLLLINPISISQNNAICLGDSILINGIFVSSSGSYSDTLISSIGCDSIFTINLSIINTSFSRTVHICLGDSALLGGSYTSSPGIYYDSLVSTVNGCDSILSSTLIIDSLPIIASLSNDTFLCAGSSILLAVSGTGTPLWSNGSNANSINVSPTISQYYYVRLRNAAGCEVSDSIFVTVKPVPFIAFNPSYTICLGQSVDISLPGEYTYLWGDGSTDSNRTFSPYNSTSYPVTVTNSDGCSTNYAALISISLSDVKINILPDDTISLGTIVNLEAVSMNSSDSIITWIPLSNPLDSHNRIININPTESGYYRVVSTSTLGCIYMDSVWIFVLKPDSIAVPTGFSPNGDGINDFFRPFYSTYLRLLHFRVYNRWGELVYEMNEDNYANRGWDGTYKGRPQGLGSFVFYVEAINIITGEHIHRSGNVTLLR